ncbi:DNA repair exonuclease SbcCD ATPase subunit [Desulfohalotomaculum tongense]|uniref:ATP-binding protein n=1 Tax=Desulforadius tongensis TaxID=1216062 RepID=UPI0019573573|nr:ATP-binding protein [Desulforadius tongensis]MBM7854753.1 DNA repair exonuclease SbcCD ATPase subunit [Desulforadius tongensis]
MSVHWQRILKISVHGGFMDGQEIEFSPHLNCLIGGRGSGKSTVVELLRYALDCVPGDQVFKKRSQRHVQAVLGGGTVTVTVQSAGGSIYKIKRQMGYRPQVLDEKGRPLGLELHHSLQFPLMVFGQSELEQVADDAAARLAVLDGMIPERQRYTGATNQLRRQLETIRPEVAALEEKIKQLEQKTKLIPGLKERLKELEEYDLDGLMARRQQREQERFWLRELYRETQRKQRYYRQKAAELTFTMPERFESWANAHLIEQALSAFAGMLEREKKKFSTLAVEWEKLHYQLEPLQNELADRHREAEEQDRPLVGKLYGQNLAKAMDERSECTGMLLELEQLERQLKEKQQKLNHLNGERKKWLAELEELERELFVLRSEAARQAGEQMGEKLRVTVSRQGDCRHYRRFLADILAASGLHYNRLVELIVTQVPPGLLAQIIRNRESHLLVTLAGLDEDRADKVMNSLSSRLTPELLLELEEMPVADWVEVELLDGHTWKPSDILSKGQRCTAILPLLLLDSSQPLIIDQPEDHLDNAYIYSTVVPALKKIKTGRQIILATHNANIPVLGRAEKNIVLDSNGRRGWVACSGGLEKQQVLELLELLLEGGAGALQSRLETYRQRGEAGGGRKTSPVCDF